MKKVMSGIFLMDFNIVISLKKSGEKSSEKMADIKPSSISGGMWLSRVRIINVFGCILTVSIILKKIINAKSGSI